jgi:hypothetical protein
MREQIEALFKKFCEGTEQDKVEVAEALRKPENFDMMRSAEFVQVAISWAERMGIKKMTDEEAEAYDAALEEPEICPHCGQEMES